MSNYWSVRSRPGRSWSVRRAVACQRSLENPAPMRQIQKVKKSLNRKHTQQRFIHMHTALYVTTDCLFFVYTTETWKRWQCHVLRRTKNCVRVIPGVRINNALMWAWNDGFKYTTCNDGWDSEHFLTTTKSKNTSKDDFEHVLPT